MSKLRGRALPLGVIALLLALAVPSAGASEDSRDARASLDGYQETPTLVTNGHGRFRAKINDNSIDYVLTYDDLEGTTTTQAHIHIGRPAIQGNVSVFLCGGAPPSSNKPACPHSATGQDTVRGTIVASDVIGPANQGVNPTEFERLVRAMRAGATYANVHTNKYGSGEIRGRIRVTD